MLKRSRGFPGRAKIWPSRRLMWRTRYSKLAAKLDQHVAPPDARLVPLGEGLVPRWTSCCRGVGSSATAYRPSFFFRVPEKTPRTVWRCHPVALAPSSMVAPSGRCSIAITSSCFDGSAGRCWASFQTLGVHLPGSIRQNSAGVVGREEPEGVSGVM
jgi:hypothetical protein